MHKSIEGPKMDVGCAAIPPEQDPQNLKPDGDRMDEHRPRRTLLKTHKPNWKDKLRENCLRRVRRDRERLLWRFRHNEQLSQDMVTSAFRDIVCDEYQKIRQSTFGISDKISETSGDDPLWEFNSLDVICESNEREYIELMTEMERLLHEDIAAQVIKRDRQLLEDYERIVDDEDKYLAQAVFEHMQLNEKQVNLDFVRDRLGKVIEEHLDKGCRAKPEFCLETRFGFTALYVKCQHCATFDIVV
ncbi:uncharacterized protein LOC116248236 isoform X2 [Nymphaea colorata]|uniref:uncharacterized protein LOC116248236 isoform X2 n=1 Tax=Nymphaea colorata TaxID=210225 RepID=UPI00129EAA14|nr:uncharacterized protein LOC116248236 isoform X2 [Nymphaea colorata]